MEKLQFDYSHKNIPMPTERNDKLQLMEKIELVIKRMRWKVHFYNEKKDVKENETQTIPENYCLKSLNCSPQVKELIQFESNLLDIIKLLKFQKTRSHFQKRLKDDINTIHNTATTLTFADKTSNLYKFKKEQYQKMLSNSITTTYKKASDNIHNKINTDGKKLMKDKDILNRMLTNGKNECFITLKDHKPNFKNNPKARLINPAKNEIGRISKNILDKINYQLRDSPVERCK